MKATAHWLDEVFTEQIVKTGKIEESRTMRRFFQRTGQALVQPWMKEMVMRLMKGLPVGLLTRMGLATLFAPKTNDWSKASAAIQEYIDEQHEKHEQALSLAQLVETAKQDVAA